MGLSRKVAVALVIAALVVGVVIGFLSGYYSPGVGTGKNRLTREAADGVREKLLGEINAGNIRRNLRKLTRTPHLAGTEAAHQTAQHIARQWQEQGLTGVKMLPYSVMLSYPDKDNPNRIVLRSGTGDIVHTSQLAEKIVRPEQNHSDVVPPFNAFSAPGTPKGPLVYVNYARMEDFLWLKDNKHINFNGTICIARYGKLFRGDKAKHAQEFGASGLIIYSDPKDYSAGTTHSVYPDSWWLPGTGVQRGSLNMNVDPLTPGYPSTESAYYLPDGEANLPKIPVHPIGFEDAKIFLENIAGDEAPESWRGALPITYRLGPGFKEVAWSLQMYISTHNENRTTYNVVGFIEGEIEPDRYVLLGNHHDAWVFGAVDPSSGTASMLELSRTLSKLVKEGWRPRRTIVFCAWGSEEQGLIGSREWVENFAHILGNRAVAYLNVDMTIQGNYSFGGRALPMLFRALYDAAKQVPNPNPHEIAEGRPTVYDTWVIGDPQKDANGKPTGKPRVPLLGAGSDFTHFISKAGVTCADLRYRFDGKQGISSYPLYHSVYETFYLVDKIMDPTFAYSKATTQLWGELARSLADSYILPFDVESFASAIEDYAERIEVHHGWVMKDHGLERGLEYLRQAVVKFRSAVEQFRRRVESVDRQNQLAVRQLNDQMMQLERAFIDPLGLPGRPLTRNVMFAPSLRNQYAGSSFPGLSDALFEISRDPDQETRWHEVSKQLAVITYFIETAAVSLHKPVDF